MIEVSGPHTTTHGNRTAGTTEEKLRLKLSGGHTADNSPLVLFHSLFNRAFFKTYVPTLRRARERLVFVERSSGDSLMVILPLNVLHFLLSPLLLLTYPLGDQINNYFLDRDMDEEELYYNCVY